MKEEIKKLSLIPVLLFFIFSVFFFVIFYQYIRYILEKDIYETEKRVINIEKMHLKQDVDKFKKTFNLIFDTSYSVANSNLEIFLKILLEKNTINNFYISKDNSFIYGKVINKKLNYEIYKNRYIILNYKNNKFLVYFINKGKNVYIAGINKKYLDNLALNKIKKYLDEINKNNPNYIAMGKITTFNPDKDGIFGYLYYMPLKLREMEGFVLSTKKPDVKGNYFRKKYLECFKKHKNCFIEYYFKNPKTGKIEQKISYFTLIKNFNFDILKGIYASQIKNEIKKEIVGQQKEFKKIFLIGIFIYFVLLIILYIVLTYFIQKFQNRILNEYGKLIEKLRKRYYFDSLTNLPNRHKLIKNLDNYEGLILIDIDDFSDVNDVYGFDMGNEILRNFSKRLLSKYKNVYRSGNDEFVIGFKRKITKKDLCEIANNKYEFNLIEISFSISGSNEKGKLLKTAESALKKAKKNSENCVLFNEKIEKEQSERIKTIQKLKKVLEYKRIIPYYQCIKGEKEKYEALMRVEIDGEIMPPFYFMDLLKEAKLYYKFSEIMIQKVLDDVKNERIKNVSINLSFIDIVNEETNRFLLNLVNNCKKTSEITFEILESESIKDFELVKKFIDYVKSKGIKISIDDFGSGYSNYIRILELKPDFIKIDGTIVKNINNDKYYEIIKLMIEFAKKFNIKTVAEFVENEEIYNKLKNLGIDYYQGYYFCKPEKLENLKK